MSMLAFFLAAMTYNYRNQTQAVKDELQEVLKGHLTRIQEFIDEDSMGAAKFYVDGFMSVVLPIQATALTATVSGDDVDVAWTAGAEGDFEDVWRIEGNNRNAWPDGWTKIAADIPVLTAAYTDVAPPPSEVGYVYTVVSKLADLEAMPSLFRGANP